MLVMHFWDHGLVPSLLFAAINIILIGARESLLYAGRDLQLYLLIVLGVACVRSVIQIFLGLNYLSLLDSIDHVDN